MTVTGCYRAQIIYFFRMQIGPRTRSGIGLGSSSRLRRMRRFLGLSRELLIQNLGTAGFVHLSCLAEQAKILVAEAEENNLGNERYGR